jgi:hypothetical protein
MGNIMMIFEKEQVKEATHLSRFMDFINEIVPLYEEEIPLYLIAFFPWDEIQKRLRELIITALRNFTDSAGQSPSVALPKILKGVYFCLADDARHFSAHGSFYYNEEDWAASADYSYQDSAELFMQLSDDLASLQLDAEVIRDLLFMFAAFTLLKTLRTINNIKDVANAAMALGYSDGDILILGHFLDQQFNEHIEIVENGAYENPSTAPVEVYIPVAPRGELWNYMKDNFTAFLQEHGFLKRFCELGETEAERIRDEFKSQLNFNRCPLCNALKRTPRARLCIKCGEFTPPVGY